MNESVQVEYVGLKDQETDHLYGTGLVWVGKGDVKAVPADKWARMKVHADVWREVGTKPAAAPVVPVTKMLPAPLDTLTDPEVHVLAKERDYKLNHKLAGVNLRTKFAEAEAADARVTREKATEAA